MANYDSWVQNELGLWVPGDGAEIAAVQGGVTKKVQTGQAAGNVPYITSAGVLRAPTLEADSASITNDITAGGSVKAPVLALSDGRQLSMYGNLIVETSGEYGLVGWNISSGGASANYDARFGGPNILFNSAVTTEMYTGVHIYSPVTFRDYWLTFSLETLASGATFDYQVELYDSTNGTLLGTIVPWTAVSTGVHVVDLGAGTWPSNPPSGNAFLRIYFRSTDTARLRLVSVTPNEPGLPDPNHVAREYLAYYYMHTGPFTKMHVAYGQSIAASATVYLGDYRIYVPEGYRVKVGRAAYVLGLAFRAQVILAGIYWESPDSNNNIDANKTIRNPGSSTSTFFTLAVRNTYSSSQTLTGRSSIAAAVWVLPF